jgi:hypothetical protein
MTPTIPPPKYASTKYTTVSYNYPSSYSPTTKKEYNTKQIKHKIAHQRTTTAWDIANTPTTST